MQNDIAIKVCNLSKCYKLYDKPVDRLKESLNPFKKKYHKDFYALNEVSFEIKRGETVGIIGKNGSGKSTLLKIITGIVTPTKGNIIINGKISALLELGAGFNPEFTGIENIYMNGAIMGYSRKEMDHKLAGIIDFADIGEFIYQPVKMYSSGMFARLAFSVAISIDPDILVVDEALSVGDFMFQHKCMKKFKDLQNNGTTILFVSHSTQQIISTCNKAILLNEGHMINMSDDVEGIIFEYENLIRNTKTQEIDVTSQQVEDLFNSNEYCTEPNKSVNEYRLGTYNAIIRDVFINYDRDKWNDEPVLKAGSKIICKLLIFSKNNIKSAVCGISIKNIKGEVLWGDNTLSLKENLVLTKGKNIIMFEFDLNISPGEYLLYVGLADISTDKRIELDQRWPVKRINIVNQRVMAEGYVYAPSKIRVSYFK